MSGEGLRLRLTLARLRAERGVTVTSCRLPFAAISANTSSQIISGIAADWSVDLEQTRIAKSALRWAEDLPLRWKHGPICGRVLSLEQRDDMLWCVAFTDHSLAKVAPAFSITMSDVAWELKDSGKKDFHVRINSAVVDDVPVTESPANPHARILHRFDAPVSLKSWSMSA
jgi:hypothetical protein